MAKPKNRIREDRIHDEAIIDPNGPEAQAAIAAMLACLASAQRIGASKSLDRVGTGALLAETTELVAASGLWQVRSTEAENFGADSPRRSGQEDSVSILQNFVRRINRAQVLYPVETVREPSS